MLRPGVSSSSESGAENWNLIAHSRFIYFLIETDHDNTDLVKKLFRSHPVNVCDADKKIFLDIF